MTVNRIVGQNSGIDVDSVVKQSLSNEQNKIDKAYQKQMVYTYEQEQLKQIVSDTEDFYDKYLDRLASGNMLSTSNYQTIKFTTTDSHGNSSTAVTAKGYAGAEVGNYSVSVEQIAKKASVTLKDNNGQLQNAIDSGNGVLAVTMKDSKGNDLKAYVDIVFKNGEIDLSSTASALNTELKKKGINVSAKYSEFSNGIVLESGESGEEVKFGTSVIANHSTQEYSGTNEEKEAFENLFDYGYHMGQNAKGTITKGTGEDAVVYQINRTSNVVTVDNIEFTFNSATNGSELTTDAATLRGEHGSYADRDSIADNTTVTLEGSNGKTTVIKKDHSVTTQKYNDGISFRLITASFDGTSEILDSNGNVKDLSTDTSIHPQVLGNKTIYTKDGITTTLVNNGGTITKTSTYAKNGINLTSTYNGADVETKVKYNGKEVNLNASEDTMRHNGLNVEFNSGKITVKASVVDGNLSALSKDDTSASVHTESDGSIRVYKDGKTTIISSDGNTMTTTKNYDNGITVKTTLVTTTTTDPTTGRQVKNTDISSEIIGGTLSDLTVDYEHNPDLKITIENEGTSTDDYVSKKTTIVRTTDENGDKVENTSTTIGKNDGTSELIKTSQRVESNGSLGTPETKEYTTEAVTLAGTTDVTDLKDKIVKFVDDYNTLIKSINDKLWEKRDKDYMPLTDSQKEEMTDSQIESWEKKAKTGLLRSDSDLQRIQNEMKSAMGTLMSGTGLTLESIGISPVDDYTTKNGMYEIDESKLTSALENNADEVKDLFTRTASGDDKGGVIVQLQSALKSEVKSSSSALATRIGFEGTSTESDNTLTNYINQQKKLIKELKSKYSDKETALYNKYSNLEVMLEKLNSQTNSLYSMLGLSS